MRRQGQAGPVRKGTRRAQGGKWARDPIFFTLLLPFLAFGQRRRTSPALLLISRSDTRRRPRLHPFALPPGPVLVKVHIPCPALPAYQSPPVDRTIHSNQAKSSAGTAHSRTSSHIKLLPALHHTPKAHSIPFSDSHDKRADIVFVVVFGEAGLPGDTHLFICTSSQYTYHIAHRLSHAHTSQHSYTHTYILYTHTSTRIMPSACTQPVGCHEVRYIPLSYNHADSQASALRLVLTLNPHWKDAQGRIEFVRFTDGITNTVCISS